MNDDSRKRPRKRGGKYAAGNVQNTSAYHHEQAGNRKKKSTGNKVLTVLCVLLFLILGLLIIGSAYVESLLNQIKRIDPSDTTLSSEQISQIENPQTDPIPSDGTTSPTMDPTDITWNTDPYDPIVGEHLLNILLIGQDAREWQPGTQRSDAMILCTINKDTKTLTMTSFMRDLYVQIPGHKDNRLNASYQLGGMKLLDECLEKNFGVKVDGNIEVNFGGFMKLIDRMGGIDMELTAEEAAYLNRRGNWDIEDNAGEWELTEGMNHLTGSQALAYSRIRDIGADFERTERQRKVLTELLEMVKKLDLFQLNSLLYEVLDMVRTDLSNAQITDIVLDIFKILGDLEIKTQRIPEWGMFENARIRGMQVLVPDLEKCRKLLEEAMVMGG